MNKLILFILLFFSIQLSQAQKAVVALPAMNVIYIGLDNPLKIAVEGYVSDQLAIDCENCTIVKASDYYILKVTKPGTCKVIVSYKKKKMLKTDTLLFRVKSVPKPESMFGELESGPLSVKALLEQYTINAVLPNFFYDGISFKVVKFGSLFVPKYGVASAFNPNNDIIPLELKRLIINSRTGDKILVDDIQVTGPGGVKKRLGPIAITIDNYFPQPFEFPERFIYQKENDNEFVDIKTSEIYNTKREYRFESGILKGYNTKCLDSQLILEVKRDSKKILWEKHYYASGKLETVYNFEENDSVGTAFSYYENGQIKSQGNVIVKSININEHYRPYVSFGNCIGYREIMFLDTFLIQNYAPYGHWKCYSDKGMLLLDCNLKIFNYGQIPIRPSDPEFDFSNNNPNKKSASIKEAMESKDSYFRPAFSGSFKLYNREGNIIKEETFKD